VAFKTILVAYLAVRRSPDGDRQTEGRSAMRNAVSRVEGRIQ